MTQRRALEEVVPFWACCLSTEGVATDGRGGGGAGARLGLPPRLLLVILFLGLLLREKSLFEILIPHI